MISLNNLSRLHASIRRELLAAVERVIDSGEFVLGGEVAAFESAAADFLGAEHAVGVASGTAALELALRAADVRGETVLTTSFSFVATATAILAAGGTPAFVDIDPDTLHMDVAQTLARADRLRPKVILPVHLFGQTLNVRPLCDWAAAHDAVVIEDAAQAFGARRNGAAAGTVGSMGCYSFFPTKNLGGLGDGGLIVTNSAELAVRLRSLREPLFAGEARPHATNARLDGLQAAALGVKLRHLEDWNRARYQLAERYLAAFREIPDIRCLPWQPGDIVHQFTLRTARRDALRDALLQQGIGCRVYYERTLPDYLGLTNEAQACVAACRAAAEVLSLPMHPHLQADEQQRVIDAVRSFFAVPGRAPGMCWPDCGWAEPVNEDPSVRGCLHPLVHAAGGLVTPSLCGCCDHPREIVAVSDNHRTEPPAPAGKPSHVPQVRHWAVGVTTAPRRPATLVRTLCSLEQAGWDQPRIFAEPGVVLPRPYRHLPVTHRDATLGAFPNWWLGLSELVVRKPRAEAYFLCQDDVVFTSGLRDYLERTLWPSADVGVVSVYCPSHWHESETHGFHEARCGWNAWGALAYVFSNPGARALLTDPDVLGHRHHGPAEGQRNIDSVVGHWCERTGRGYFVHSPSLAQHIGDASTLWSHATNSGRRRAAAFMPSLSRHGPLAAAEKHD